MPYGAVIPPPGAPRPRLTFLGMGYLGATYATCFAELGYEVIGFDIDINRIARLADGEMPFHEPGLDGLLKRNLAAGRLRFSTNLAQTAAFGDVHFICVGTTQRADGMGAELSSVEGSVGGLARHLTRKALIVGKSTVPVGTAEWVEQLVGKHAPAELGVEVAWSPEFLQEGLAVEDVLRPNRIVVGVNSEWARRMLCAAHQGVLDLAAAENRKVPVVVTNFATAELVKVAGQCLPCYQDLLHQRHSRGLRGRWRRRHPTRPRHRLRPPHRQPLPASRRRFRRWLPPQGHPCLPGPRAGTWRRRSPPLPPRSRPDQPTPRARVLQLAADLLARRCGPAGPDLSGTRMAVLGATFKPNSDDVRDAPSLAVAALLAKAGAHVRVDPQGMPNARRAQPDLTYAPTMTDAVRDADLVCVLTEWAEFRNADPHVLGALVARRHIIDDRNCLDPARWIHSGWEYRGMGRPCPTRPTVRGRPGTATRRWA